jgi:hypothetical protein
MQKIGTIMRGCQRSTPGKQERKDESKKERSLTATTLEGDAVEGGGGLHEFEGGTVV